MRKTAYLFDRYGPSTAYAVCFTVNALCLLTGFPWLQENKKVSQQLKQHTGGKAKRGSHGGWGEVLGRGCVCCCVCVWGRETGGEKGEVRACVLSICGETRHCKNKSLKRSSKLTDKQTSVTNSSNTDVQVQNKKNKKLKIKKKKRPNQDHTRHISTQRRPRTTTHRVMTQPWNPLGGSFPLFETQSGPLVDLQTNCCYTTVAAPVPLA